MANKIWTVMISTKSAMVTVLQSVCVNVIIFHASKKKKKEKKNYEQSFGGVKCTTNRDNENSENNLLS